MAEPISPYQYPWTYDGPDDAPDETPNEWMEWYKPFHAAIQSGHVGDGRGIHKTPAYASDTPAHPSTAPTAP